MLEKITGTSSNIIRTMSGKSTITEKNIEETVEQIKMALLEADVNLRVVRRFVNSTIEEAKDEKVLKSVNPGQQFVKIIMVLGNKINILCPFAKGIDFFLFKGIKKEGIIGRLKS